MFFPESRLASCGTVIYAMACPITHFDLTCPIYIKTTPLTQSYTLFILWRNQDARSQDWPYKRLGVSFH